MDKKILKDGTPTALLNQTCFTCFTRAAILAYSHKTSDSRGESSGWPAYGFSSRIGKEIGGAEPLVDMERMEGKVWESVEFGRAHRGKARGRGGLSGGTAYLSNDASISAEKQNVNVSE